MHENKEEKSRQASFAERYASGQIPWDDRLPPPELIALVDDLAAGKALDLGAGYGRTSIYLAKHGWQIDAVEFVAQAVEEARRRAIEERVENLVKFHVADATDLGFLYGPYDLAVDIGCMHTLELHELERYRDELMRLLKPGATYLLFAHLTIPDDESENASQSEDNPRWIKEPDLRELFGHGFLLSQVVHGITQVPDRPPWPSAWFYFQRR